MNGPKVTSKGLERQGPDPHDTSKYSGSHSSLEVSAPLLSKGVYEVQSGVYFAVKDQKVVATLGSESVALDGVPAEAVATARRQRTFPSEMARAFTETVMPHLIEPVQAQLREEIRTFSECGPRSNSPITAVEITSIDPLEFTIKGSLFSGRTSYEYEGSCTWNNAGTLTVISNGKTARMPVSDLLGGNHGKLGRIMAKVGQVHSQA